MTGLRCLLALLMWDGSNISGLEIMAMRAAKEAACALQLCMGLVQAPVAIAVLPCPEATSAVPPESVQPRRTQPKRYFWSLSLDLLELQSKIHKSSTESVQHYTSKKSNFPPNQDVV